MSNYNYYKTISPIFLARVVEAIESCHDYLLSSETSFGGFITHKPISAESDPIQFLDFHPMKFHQISTDPIISFDRFSLAVDHFFGQIQTQKSEQKMVQAEKAALKKLENVKIDHLKRLEGLKTTQESNVTKAQLIEMNLELVEAALNQVEVGK